MSLKVYRFGDPVQFNYIVDNELVILETYQGATRFLSALNAFISYNNTDKTRWKFERSLPDDNTVQSFLGRDGLRYNDEQPTSILERQANGIDPIMGSGLYIYVPIQLVNESDFADNQIYIANPMGGYQTMAVWKTQNRFIENTTINDSEILGLKETVTGFSLNLSKLNSLLGLNGDPQTTAIPRDVVLQMQLIKIHFDNRSDRMTGLGADGSLDF